MGPPGGPSAPIAGNSGTSLVRAPAMLFRPVPPQRETAGSGRVSLPEHFRGHPLRKIAPGDLGDRGPLAPGARLLARFPDLLDGHLERAELARDGRPADGALGGGARAAA